jgi:murein DD-endopeptidase MepM/ murein hydrolase activator NlpD
MQANLQVEFATLVRFMRFRALLAGVVAPIVLWAVIPVGTIAQSRLSTLQDKINSTQGKIEKKKGSEHVLTTQISVYNRRISELQGSISSLTVRVTRLQADLDRKRALLGRIQSELRFQRARQVRLRVRLLEAKHTLSVRLVELYQSDRPDLVTVLLNSKGFADLIEREEFIRRIGEQDRHIIDLVAAAKRDATSASARLAVLEKRQQKITAEVFGQRNEIAQARGLLVDKRSGWESQRQQRANVLGSIRQDRHELEGKLDDLQAEEAKIQNALSAANGSPTLPAGPIRGGGQLIWPVNGPITSPFCEPRAWEACHPGIDIGVPAGTPIRAAAAGTVALMQSEASSGGYGNFTCIAHSSSMSTCYAHQSRFATSMGARVSQGQVIGYVGCTGRCYGDHLHFEVRINGAVTNPLNYL